MGLLPLHNDVARRIFVISANNEDEFLIGRLYQEDILQIEFDALKPTGNVFGPNRYEVLNLTGYALEICVALTPGTPLAVANTFTIDALGQKLTGDLNLNTVGISALGDRTQLILEVNLSLGGKPHRTQQAVEYRKAACISGSLIPTPGDTALGSIAADRTYVRKAGRAGEGYTLMSPDGTKQCFCYMGDDGVFHADAIA